MQQQAVQDRVIMYAGMAYKYPLLPYHFKITKPDQDSNPN
jgi:hypothetical protein